MKVLKKTQALILCIALAVLCIAPMIPQLTCFVSRASAASEQKTEQKNYYGMQLTDPVSVAFYDILETMDFKSGESVAISDKSILDEAAAYTVGDPSVMKKLGAAVDSFRYDHTEYFYVDFDMLTLNVKTRGNTLIAELGAGRSDSYFVDGFNKDNVDAAISWYNTELDKFVNSLAVPENATTEQKAKIVIKAVAEKITYDFCVDKNGQDTEGAPFIRTAYGALKYGKGVCEGYSRLFKATMDKLGETNVLVNGWLASGEEMGAHMWNLVKDGDNWYGADPTVADEEKENYNARGLDWAQGELLGIDHFVDGFVSSSGYEMPFPKIFRKDIVDTSDSELEQEVNGLKVEVSEDKKTATISYNGKDSETLKKEQLYMAVRVVTLTDGVEDPNSVWVPFSVSEQYGMASTADGKSTFNITAATASHVAYVQFAVCNADADGLNPVLNVKDRYTDEFFNAHVVAKTEKAIINDSADPNYEAPLRGTPDCTLITLDTKDGEQPRTITVKYSRDLAFDNDTDTTPVVTFVATRIADGSPVDVGEFASVTDVKRVDNNGISFVFRPSISYSHNEVAYKFSLENMHCVRLNGKTGKTEPFTIAASRTSIVCNKVFGDSKLYVEAFGTPTLVDNTDLSMNGWSYTDKNGETQKVSQSQRSQLALVVRTPSNKDELESTVNNVVGANNVKNMATYELDLNICRRIATIPQGSYLKLSFGFPEGITADMAGVEFEVFHFKKNADGSLDYDHPERLNCVVTKYGLTVTVDGFSPFVIVAREKTESDNAQKGIVTAVNGVGGTVTADTNKPVNFLETNGSVTYTITPDSGYAVEYVMLGNKELTVENGKVTVNFSDLTDKNNVLSVGFASQKVLEKEQAAGETNAVKSYAAKTYDKNYAATPDFDNTTVGNEGVSGGMIVLIVIAVLVGVLAIGVLVGWYFMKRKSKSSK